VQLSPNTDLDKVSKKIMGIKPAKKNKEAVAPVIEFFLHPMSKWHLH
jgi:hypothetical protein